MLFELKRSHINILNMFQFWSRTNNFIDFFSLKERTDLIFQIGKLSLTKEELVFLSQTYNKNYKEEMHTADFHTTMNESLSFALIIIFNDYNSIPHLGKYNIKFSSKVKIRKPSSRKPFYSSLNESDFKKYIFLSNLSDSRIRHLSFSSNKILETYMIHYENERHEESYLVIKIEDENNDVVFFNDRINYLLKNLDNL